MAATRARVADFRCSIAGRCLALNPCGNSRSSTSLIVASSTTSGSEGTAAIVGHRSLHAGDPLAQTRESLVNIRAVCDEAARIGGGRPFAAEELEYVVYVRDAAMLAAVQRTVRAAIGAATPALYVEADICRADLLVEIEAGGLR